MMEEDYTERNYMNLIIKKREKKHLALSEIILTSTSSLDCKDI